jgi:hypothetical protein
VTEQWVDYPHSDEAVRAHCLTHPMSTAHRQFSKLTLNKDSQQAWWLAVRVYDAEGKLQKKTSLPL